MSYYLGLAPGEFEPIRRMTPISGQTSIIPTTRTAVTVPLVKVAPLNVNYIATPRPLFGPTIKLPTQTTVSAPVQPTGQVAPVSSYYGLPVIRSATTAKPAANSTLVKSTGALTTSAPTLSASRAALPATSGAVIASVLPSAAAIQPAVAVLPPAITIMDPREPSSTNWGMIAMIGIGALILLKGLK